MTDQPQQKGPRRSHPKCWTEAGHVCQEPTGVPCIEQGCNQPAGTWWGTYWCPDHDVERLDRVSAGFESIKAFIEDRSVQ